MVVLLGPELRCTQQWCMSVQRKLERGRHLGRASRSVATITVATDGKMKKHKMSQVRGWGTTWRLWVVISGVISPLIWVIRIATLLLTRCITTHEPPSATMTTPASALRRSGV